MSDTPEIRPALSRAEWAAVVEKLTELRDAADHAADYHGSQGANDRFTLTRGEGTPKLRPGDPRQEIRTLPERTCAVIVAAYRTPEEWLRGCLDSIREQEPLQDWRCELRVGVDGCEETAAALDRLSTPYRYSPENVGPYLIRNALIEEAPADAYAIFDADDRMDPTYLRTLIPTSLPAAIAGSARRAINEDGAVVKASYKYVNGVCVLTRSAWETVGGYRPWRMAADHDLIQRARALGVPVHKHPEPLYSRRRHPGSLTRHPRTGLRSNARRKLKRESKRAVAQWYAKQDDSLRIDPVCAEFTPDPAAAEVA